jgi:hypothetical protein
MAIPNRVSATLSQEDQDALLNAVATIRQKLSFLLGLNPDERRTLPRLGDKSRAFVTKALEVATQNPDFLPRSFDIDEMKQDVRLFDAMYPLLLSLTQLQELLDDTTTAVGSEAYAAALLVYGYAKTSGRNTGLDAAVDDMSQRFARKAARTAAAPST